MIGVRDSLLKRFLKPGTGIGSGVGNGVSCGQARSIAVTKCTLILFLFISQVTITWHFTLIKRDFLDYVVDFRVLSGNCQRPAF